MPARLAASMTSVPGGALTGLPSMVRVTRSGMGHTCVNSGADPLVRSRPPGRPLAFGRKLIPNEERVQGDPRGPGGPPHRNLHRHCRAHRAYALTIAPMPLTPPSPCATVQAGGSIPMIKADRAELSWDAQKKRWAIRIQVGEEVVKRSPD